MPNALAMVLRRLRPARPVRPKHRLAQADLLETRILPTAVVTFTGTLLTITGDTDTNEVLVERTGNQLHVAGQNGTLIKVQGTDVTEYFFPIGSSFNLTAKFQGGDDQLFINNGLQLRSVNIAMGDGENFVGISNAVLSGKLTIKSGAEDDFVSLFATAVTSNTLIETGSGGDLIDINDGKFIGSTTIRTALGEDEVRIGNVEASGRVKFVGKLTVNTGDDDDFVRIEIVESKAFAVDTGAGNDDVIVEDMRTYGAANVKTGAGEDELRVSELFQTGSATNIFDLGSETDEAEFNVSVFAGSTTINLGSGLENFLGIDDVTFNQVFTLNSQGTDDEIEVELQTGFIGSTTFVRPAKFNLGQTSTVTFGMNDPDSLVRFLSTVALTSLSPPSTLFVTVTNVNFFSPPVLTNVTRIDL